MSHLPLDLASDSDSDQDYREEQQINEIQGRLEAIDVAGGHPGSSHSNDVAVGSYRSVDDEPPMPLPAYSDSIAGIHRRGTLALDEKEDAAQIAELREVYAKVAECLHLRSRFMKASIQYETENPKNKKGWKIYPAPPAPEWDPVTKQFMKPKNPDPSPDNIGKEFDLDKCDIPPADKVYTYELNEDFVYCVMKDQKPIADVPSLKEYYQAFDMIAAICSDGPSKTFAFRRMQYLEAKWNLYQLLNSYDELAKSKRIPHRDFYNVRKVDTHVHHSACMTQKHLLRFIKKKMKTCPDEVVIFRDGKELTLNQVFESLNLTAYDLSIDTLDMHAHQDSFQRFDKFNLKYNPVGESRLREIFLKTDNLIKGRYLAEITREVFSDLEQSKYQMAEYRISIYGRSLDEWSKLAAWVVDNKLFSDNVRWLIQVPRLYDIYKRSGLVENFGELVRNLFEPLFEVTRDPSRDPKLYIFLQRVVGFDSVDDESKQDRRFSLKYPAPNNWDFKQNPPYGYYLYYLYSNMAYLNQYRARLGYNTFVLRPHCGEAGDPEHLINAFLTSQAISHGILLRKLPFMQFLFYLDQIGLAVSPLSNNALFLAYEKNPFIHYFRRGMNVSLSSDDPLQFAFTRDPLIEEYSIAIQIYKLSAVDSRELALNSVKQSGFEHEIKEHWGYDMHKDDVNIEKTNVPDCRLAFRGETLKHERALVDKYGTGLRK